MITAAVPRTLSNLFIPPGVSPEIASQRNYRTIQSSRQLGGYEHQLTERQQQIPGLLFPAYRLGDAHPYTYVLRADSPRMGQDGKMVKYEWPERVPLCLDVLPCYREALADPTIPIWITEGAKKADALASAFGSAIVPININGVWGWRRRGKDGASHPIDDFDGITWAGRRVILAFDNDVTRKPEVQDALRALERHLTKERGAHVGVLILPYMGEKVGVDDALAGDMTPEQLRGYVRGLDDLTSSEDDFDTLPPDELRRRLRTVIAEREQWKQRAEQLQLELGLVEEGTRLVQERNRFTTGAIGANIAATGKRLTLIELKTEQDTAPGDGRQEGDMFIARGWKIAQRTNQNPGTVSKHLTEFEHEGYIERATKRVKDPKTGEWTSATFIRPLVDLGDPSQIVMPAKPRGLHACSNCGSMKVKRHSVRRCTCCGHEEGASEEWVNPQEVRDMEDGIVASQQRAEAELQTAIQDEQLPEPAPEPLTCNMRCNKDDRSYTSELQTAIQSDEHQERTHQAHVASVATSELQFAIQKSGPRGGPLLDVSDPSTFPGVRSGLLPPDDPWFALQRELQTKVVTP